MSTDRVAVIPVPGPGSYRDSILSDAIAVGDLNEYLLGLQQSVAHTAMLKRIDEGVRAHAATERLQEQARKQLILSYCDSVDKFARRLDAYEAEQAIRQQQEAEEQERQDRLRIKHKIDALPDPDRSENWGELGVPIPATTQQDQGNLPSELLEGAPPHPGNFTEVDPDDPRQIPQPTAVSLW